MFKQKKILNFKDIVKKTAVFKVLKALEQAGFEAFIVGGAARDLLLNKEPFDFDLATDARPKDIKILFPKHLTSGERFGTVKVLVGSGQEFEITSYRSEDVYTDSRHPDHIKFAKTAAEDSLRRDFTINAIYLDSEGNIFDPQNGIADINLKLIKTVGYASERFKEDSLRVLRCFRFASQLGFEVDPLTRAAAIENWTSLTLVSSNRKYAELKKMIQGDFFYRLLPLLIKEKLFDDFVNSEDLSHHLGYLQTRAMKLEHFDSALTLFILDLSFFQKDIEAYLANWKEVLPFSKTEKLKLENGLYFLNALSSWRADNSLAAERVGYIIRVGLDFLNPRELELFVSHEFLAKFKLSDDKKNCLISLLQKLDSAPVKKVDAADLLAMGIPAGPSIRKCLNLAYELQLTDKDLTKSAILKALKMHGA